MFISHLLKHFVVKRLANLLTYHKEVELSVLALLSESVWVARGPDLWCACPAGSCTVRWENKTMYCIVSAFGLSI